MKFHQYEYVSGNRVVQDTGAIVGTLGPEALAATQAMIRSRRGPIWNLPGWRYEWHSISPSLAYLCAMPAGCDEVYLAGGAGLGERELVCAIDAFATLLRAGGMDPQPGCLGREKTPFALLLALRAVDETTCAQLDGWCLAMIAVFLDELRPA